MATFHLMPKPIESVPPGNTHLRYPNATARANECPLDLRPRGPSFEIVADEDAFVTIDVLEVHQDRADDLFAYLGALLDGAAHDQHFLAGALHRALPPSAQPLVWLPGAVPRRHTQLALYARWQATGHRLGFAGLARGRNLLERAAAITPDAERMLSEPAASHYVPTLIDASGELCPGQSDCLEGTLHGPIIDEANPRAQFINIFQTTPDRQQRLLDATYAIMPVARQHPGYLRTALHRSLDGTRVANYGQYCHVDQIRSMYFHLRTAKAFAGILGADVTVPTVIWGCPLRWRGVPIGSTPRLRCYQVERVIVPHAGQGAGAETEAGSAAPHVPALQN